MAGGRPITDINWEELDKLCQIQCTRLEVASWFKCSEDTIERACQREHNLSYAAYFEQKAGTGKISLRRKQWQLAMGGDKTMLIWLGKQHLSQSDKQELKAETKTEHSVTDDLKPLIELFTKVLSDK